LVVLESTTHPGTTQEVVLLLLENGNLLDLAVSRSGSEAGNVFFLAFSPGREDPGNNTIARNDIPKIVGGVDRYASKIPTAPYSAIFHRAISVSGTTVAEMTKLLENIYRCVNIALVNCATLLYRRLQQFRCLHHCSDCYRVERTSSRAGVAPTVNQTPYHGARGLSHYPKSREDRRLSLYCRRDRWCSERGYWRKRESHSDFANNFAKPAILEALSTCQKRTLSLKLPPTSGPMT
jgi:hypothetical protein